MNYPTISAKDLPKLVDIVEQAVTQEDYLDPSSCPYDEQSIKCIRRVIDICTQSIDRSSPTGERAKVGRPSKQVTIPMEEVEKEISEIRQELADLKLDGQVMDTSDRIQVIKTRAALIERVITMKERVSDLKRYHSFITTVISIMEEHLTPAERDKVMEELKQYVEA